MSTQQQDKHGSLDQKSKTYYILEKRNSNKKSLFSLIKISDFR